MSLILLGLLLFFELSLLEALADGAAHGVEDHSDRLGRIVICRDNVINVGWITTSIYHCKYGNIQSLGLLHGVGLLLHVHDEQSGRQTGQIGDRTEVLLEFRTLTRDLQLLALGEIIERAVVGHLVDGGHLLDGFTYGGEVCQHTGRPNVP